jgi:hypothetical protein
VITTISKEITPPQLLNKKIPLQRSFYYQTVSKQNLRVEETCISRVLLFLLFEPQPPTPQKHTHTQKKGKRKGEITFSIMINILISQSHGYSHCGYSTIFKNALDA